jgi:hypothetical protein
MLREGLASVVVSVMWFIVMAPLLLGYGILPPPLQLAEANHRKTETTHRKSKARYKPPAKPPWAKYCSMCCGVLNACWQKLQDVVFGMRTRRFKQGTGSTAIWEPYRAYCQVWL